MVSSGRRRGELAARRGWCQHPATPRCRLPCLPPDPPVTSITRRDFVRTGAAAAAAAALPTPALGAPAVHLRGAARPVVIASGNGNVYKNGGDATAVQKAFGMIAQGGDV